MAELRGRVMDRAELREHAALVNLRAVARVVTRVPGELPDGARDAGDIVAQLLELLLLLRNRR